MTYPAIKLSVMDVKWPGNLSRLLPVLDEVGYQRFWATEHHHPGQSASPTMIAALAAGLTKRIRVGTGGIRLSYQSPLKVAEDFRLLELFFAGRVDLGLVGGLSVGGKAIKEALLDGRAEPDSDTLPRKLQELVRLIRGTPPIDGAPDGRQIGPACETVPEIWLCGMSHRSAALAGRLGLAYSFHEYFSRIGPKRVDGPSVIETYQSTFEPGPTMPQPKFNFACYGICAETEARAAELWEAEKRLELRALSKKANRPLPSAANRDAPVPCFIGTPDRCQEQLLAKQQRYGAEEIVIQSLTDDFEAMLASYGLLAEVFRLSDVPAPVGA